MRFTVDTNFLISATQWSYSVAHKLLEKIILANHEAFATEEILEEFAKVLKRDFKYDADRVNKIVSVLVRFLTLVGPRNKVEAVAEDADDNKIIECAIESNSEYIISYDEHLLKLKEYRGIKIIKPEEALKLLI